MIGRTVAAITCCLTLSFLADAQSDILQFVDPLIGTVNGGVAVKSFREFYHC